MFECPLCGWPYKTRVEADWCRRECEDADRDARRAGR